MDKILFLLFFCNIIYGQCPTETVRIKNQEQVDSFIINYPNCTDLEVDLLIFATDINNLLGFRNLRSVKGRISIEHNKLLESLNGFDNLKKIDGGLEITSSPLVTSLSPLSNLESIGGGLHIGSLSIKDFTGLEKIRHVVSDLGLGGFEGLESWHGLHNLKSIKGFFISKTNIKDFSGLTSLVEINGSLNISDEPNLETLDGLDKCAGIYDVDISNCPNLTKVNLSSISDTISDFFLKGCPNVKTLDGLGSLEIIKGYFVIARTGLKSLKGFENLKRVYQLSLNSNDSLTSIESLSELETIETLLDIRDNKKLSSLAGLDNVDPESIDSISIFDNDSLSYCQSKTICDYLSMDKPHYLANNAPSCSDPDTILSLCISSSYDLLSDHQLKVFPNPADDHLVIQLPDEIKRYKVKIYNVLGALEMEHYADQQGDQVDISALSQGMKIIRIEVPDKSIRLPSTSFIKI